MVFMCMLCNVVHVLPFSIQSWKYAKQFLFFGITYKTVLRSEDLTKFSLKNEVMAHPNLGSRSSIRAHSFQENLKSHHFAMIYKSRRSYSCSLAKLVTVYLAVARANSIWGWVGLNEDNWLFIKIALRPPVI